MCENVFVVSVKNWQLVRQFLATPEALLDDLDIKSVTLDIEFDH